VITTASSGQSIPSAALPAGSVLQVVSATTSTVVSNSTSAYVDSGLTATITPKFATNKILVIVNQVIYKSAGNVANSLSMKLFRNSTDLGIFLNGQLYTGTAIEVYGNAGLNSLDSPATTSAVTYKTQFASGNNTASVACQPDSGGISTITLLEIAG
jgi:hypothetical protein